VQKTDWKNTAELVGIAAIVASLIFVGVQVRQSQSSANVSQVASYAEQMFELRSLLIEHADVWMRACAGEELHPVEAAQAAQLYKSYVEFTYTQGVTADLGMFDYSQLLASRMAANIHRYPGFARMAKTQSEWSRTEQSFEHVAELAVFNDMVRARLATLQELEPDPNYDVTLCGM
jgi:hypothetical protein